MKPSILPNVEEHLILLQEKKKQRRQLESHDVKQVELERKEKGFSLYVNGANASAAARAARPQSGVNHGAVLFTGAEQESSGARSRAKTAPTSRVQRRQWQIASVDLKTYTGDHIKIKAPVAATGNYADDFEDELSDDSIEEEQCDSEDSENSSVDEEISVEQSVEKAKESKVMKSLLTCSPKDVKKLRESLQMSTNVNNSLFSFSAAEAETESKSPVPQCCQLSPDENVNKLMQKILQLDSRSQQRILRELSKHDDSPRRSTAWVDKTETNALPNTVGNALPYSVENRLPASASMSRISTDTGADISAAGGKIAASSSMSRLAADASGRVSSGAVDVGSKGPADVCGRLANVQMNDTSGSRGGRTRESTDRQAGSRRQHPVQSDIQQQQQQSDGENSIESTGRCEVCIELLSNWGNTQRVGLTELELYDDSQQKMKLMPDCVTVSTQQQTSVVSDVQCLFNGKYKTVKERYMWSCDISCLPVVITLCPPRPNISYLCIWNYNHTFNDLSIGVRHVKISVNKRVVFDGEVSKGCANQIFDYDQTVSLLRPLVAPSSDSLPVQSVLTSDDLKRQSRQSIAASNRDSVATSSDSYQSSVCYSSDMLSVAPSTSGGRNGPSRLPAVSVCASTDSLSQVASCDLSSSVSTSQSVSSGARQRRRHRLQPQVAVSSELSPVREPAESGRLTESREPTSSQIQRSDNASVRESGVCTNGAELSVIGVTQQVSVSGVSGVNGVTEPVSVNRSVSEFAIETAKPPVLSSITNSETGRQSSKSNVSNADLPSWLNHSTVQSTDQSKQMNNVEEYENLLENWPRPAGLSRLPTLLDVLDSTGGSTGSLQDEDEIPPMKHIESASKRKRQNFSLEQSWTSLDLFNRCQKGRISFDIQDDILDDYLPLNSDRQKSEPLYSSGDQSTTTVAIETTQSTNNIQQQLAEEFMIPELPCGQEMVINIHTTWGDRHYVGLNGIELFAKTGQQVTVAKISADPSDINILPGYTCDPRVVGNLVDGVNRTQDDTHMWLAPFTPGNDHFIYITFEQPTCISMMRIWNYNKSRIHSSRGAKDITVMLDGVRIFVGEIARACGMMIGTIDSFGDTILFTTDEEILEQVAQFDESLDVDVFDKLNELDDDSERPGTADGTDSSDQVDRPTTSAAYLPTDDTHGDDIVFQAQDVILNLQSTWGDIHYIGLTGLELVGPDSATIPLTLDMIDAQPRDLHHLQGHEDDDRTLDKLIDGSNITTSDEHMWLIPFVDGNNHTISIHLPQRTALTGLRVWNYNKSSDDTFRGVRTMQVCLDGECVSTDEGFLVRKGPGNCYFDFAQFISFSQHSTTHVTDNKLDLHSVGCENTADCDYVSRPCGFIYQLQLLSSSADPYYIGLNGLEFYHRNGQQIQLTETDIAAYPDSVNVLADVANDIRTPDKLVDGVNDTMDGRHMWLAPVLPNIVNRVYVLFDEPVELAAIRIWNYSKTPSRGVRDIALLVDDLLVYNGTMTSSTDRTAAVHTVVFTDSLDTMQRDRNTGTRDIEEQQVDLMNDRKIISSNNNSQRRKNNVDQALRPKTSLPRRHQ